MVFQLDGIDGKTSEKWTDLIHQQEFDISNNPITTDAVKFPPGVSHPILSTIPADIENATLEVVFQGKGGLFWQNSNKLSAAYIGNRIFIKSITQIGEANNATPLCPLDNKIAVVTIQSNRVILNGKLLQITNSQAYFPDPDKVWLGYIRPQSPSELNGSIFAIRYYSRKLSDDEISYNQRCDNVRFSLGLNLEGGIVPYVPNRSITIEEDER